MNGCRPPRLLGVRPTTIQILPGCLVVGDTENLGLPRPENRFFSKPIG
jgi:hypothetical protein